MIEATEKAVEKIKQFLEDNQGGGKIRILLQSQRNTPYLAMILDEPKGDDLIVTEQGIPFIIDKELLEKAKPIRIDFIESTKRSGFQITSRLPVLGCYR